MHAEGQIFKRQGILEGMKRTGGPSEFHKPNTSEVFTFLGEQAKQDQAMGGGKPLTRQDIRSRIHDNDEAKEAINAVSPHIAAHAHFENVGMSLERALADLDAARPLEGENPFTRQRVKDLREKIDKLSQTESKAWGNVVATNSALLPQFQEEHVLEADSQGAGNE